MVGPTEQMEHFQLSPERWPPGLSPSPPLMCSSAVHKWLVLDTEVLGWEVATLLFLGAWF